MDIHAIYLDIQVNAVITLPRRNWDSSPIPPGPPPVDNFFTLHLTLVLFPFLPIRTVQFTNFGFLNFRFFYFQNSDIGLLWSKITIFIIEIYLKLHLHTKYGWNNPNWGRLGLKSLKLHFLSFLAAQKLVAHTNIQIHVTGSIFIVNVFFKCS